MKTKTIGFGVEPYRPSHNFRVEIPLLLSRDVVITEDFNCSGTSNQDRVKLPRDKWMAIADTAKRDFNDRLKQQKMSGGKWQQATNLVDRLLGKELCVLAWAAETATDEQIPTICKRWAALRPEERWWLFTMTATESGLATDTQIGCQRALFHALSGN